ncbi:MAG TPA: SOS response-associated peptidase [Steroidobacteraceae bacterium]|jgi:putative SOS response-associated peptidase YedK|nr:SOS response-associated peptidase [Steroidobacteraceae bacterium]
MCERYVFPDQAAAEREFLPASAWWSFTAKYNVAAQQYVPAVRWHDGQSEAVMLRWGFIASAPEVRAPLPPPTVGLEQMIDSPMYRGPWLNSQRCILPAAGFYAWQLTNARYRQPFFVHLLDRSVFGFAAIWDRSEGEDDDVIESCSIICVPPNELMMTVANTDDGMPAILRRKDYHAWLRGTPVQAKAALQPYNPGGMQAYRISPRINSTAPDDPGLVRPAG